MPWSAPKRPDFAERIFARFSQNVGGSSPFASPTKIFPNRGACIKLSELCAQMCDKLATTSCTLPLIRMNETIYCRKAFQPEFGAYRGLARILKSPLNPQKCRNTFIFCAKLWYATKPWFKRDLILYAILRKFATQFATKLRSDPLRLANASFSKSLKLRQTHPKDPSVLKKVRRANSPRREKKRYGKSKTLRIVLRIARFSGKKRQENGTDGKKLRR